MLRESASLGYNLDIDEDGDIVGHDGNKITDVNDKPIKLKGLGRFKTIAETRYVEQGVVYEENGRMVMEGSPGSMIPYNASNGDTVIFVRNTFPAQVRSLSNRTFDREE